MIVDRRASRGPQSPQWWFGDSHSLHPPADTKLQLNSPTPRRPHNKRNIALPPAAHTHYAKIFGLLSSSCHTDQHSVGKERIPLPPARLPRSRGLVAEQASCCRRSLLLRLTWRRPPSSKVLLVPTSEERTGSLRRRRLLESLLLPPARHASSSGRGRHLLLRRPWLLRLCPRLGVVWLLWHRPARKAAPPRSRSAARKPTSRSCRPTRNSTARS